MLCYSQKETVAVAPLQMLQMDGPLRVPLKFNSFKLKFDSTAVACLSFPLLVTVTARLSAFSLRTRRLGRATRLQLVASADQRRAAHSLSLSAHRLVPVSLFVIPSAEL